MKTLLASNFSNKFICDMFEKKIPDETALITIRDEAVLATRHDEDCFDWLSIKFADVTAPIEEKGLQPISKEQAGRIINFIIKNKQKDFMVGCAAGVSRSAAICLFIHNIFGHKLKDNFWQLSEPNPFVVGRLMVEYYKKINS